MLIKNKSERKRCLQTSWVDEANRQGGKPQKRKHTGPLIANCKLPDHLNPNPNPEGSLTLVCLMDIVYISKTEFIIQDGIRENAMHSFQFLQLKNPIFEEEKMWASIEVIPKCPPSKSLCLCCTTPRKQF